jgi:hypothetical protein
MISSDLIRLCSSSRALFCMVFIILSASSIASAQARSAHWSAASGAATFPVIPVYGCPNQFATHFPTIPWYNISRQLSAAMNEWFTGGGAHIRYKYASDLPSNDPQCANSPSFESSAATTHCACLATAEFFGARRRARLRMAEPNDPASKRARSAPPRAIAAADPVA